MSGLRRLALAALFTTSLLAGPAHADDIADSIAEAGEAYAAGDLAGAKAALDVASQLLAQASASGLGAFLPEPLDGWEGEEIETDAAMAAMFGGGVIASRRYTRGDEDVTVQFLADSPMLMQMAPMFTNAQMLGAMGKVFRIDGKTAVVTDEGDIQLMVGRAMVMIEGSASEDDKRAFLEAVDLDAVERFGS